MSNELKCKGRAPLLERAFLLGVGTVGVASEHGCLPDILSSLVAGISPAISGVLVGSPTLVIDVGFV